MLIVLRADYASRSAGIASAPRVSLVELTGEYMGLAVLQLGHELWGYVAREITLRASDDYGYYKLGSRMHRHAQSLITVSLSCLGIACASHDATREPSTNSRQLGNVVAEILAANPGWHLGTNQDCTNPNLKEQLSNNPRYQAYRAIGDLNGDNQTDRVLVVVKGDSGKVYWLPGDPYGYDTPRLLGSADWIREGGIVMSGQAVTFGRFDSDVAITWRWNAKTGMVDSIDDNPNGAR